MVPSTKPASVPGGKASSPAIDLSGLINSCAAAPSGNLLRHRPFHQSCLIGLNAPKRTGPASGLIAGLAGAVVLVLISGPFSAFPLGNDDNARALMGGGLRVGAVEIAFSEVKGDLIECALFPLFGLSQPENPALGIASRALPAHGFLTSNLDELVHELHSSGVKPTSGAHPSRVRARVPICGVENGSHSVPAMPAGIMSQRNTFTTAGP
jgi:hypothetical protein